jgi:hypothetical protein
MKSPHGQPSPALLRSIHRPYLRHNAGETAGDLTTERRKSAAPAFPQLSRNKSASLPIPVHRIGLIRLLDLTHI